MKILLITDNFLPHSGGSRVIFYNIYANLDPKVISVLTKKIPGYKEFDKKQEFRIYRCKLKEMPWKWIKIYELPIYFNLFIRSLYITLKEGIDIIHCGEVLPSGLVGYCLRLITGRPYLIYTFAEEITTLARLRTESKLIRFVLKKADCIIATCTYVESSVKDLGISPCKIIKVLPGVEDRFFQAKTDAAIQLRKELGLENRKVILTVARLIKRKGHDKIIEALPKVIKQIPNLLYLVIGKGEEEGNLRRLIQEKGLGEYVRLIGEVEHNQDKLVTYYQICDVFIMANRELPDGDTEGFGMVFAEASAVGKPVIGGRAGGSEDVIIDGVTGIRIDGGNVDEIASTLIRLLTDTSFASKLREAGHKRMAEEFRCPDKAERIYMISKDIVQKR